MNADLEEIKILLKFKMRKFYTDTGTPTAQNVSLKQKICPKTVDKY